MASEIDRNGSTGPQRYGGASSSMENEVCRWSSESVDASKVYGFEDEVTSLQRVLLRKRSDDVLNAIGIFGIAGIGKTTICQLLFNRKEVKDYFLPRIWVCMSRHPDDDEYDKKGAILKRMLLYLGVDKKIIEEVHKEKKLKGLLCALHLQLRGKRYLIAFDDARDEDKWFERLNSLSARDGNWDRLAAGLPKGYGGAVIVTSRIEEIAKMMVGEEALHCVLRLSDPTCCWSIFKDATEQKFHETDERILKKEIFAKCAGHPLTAKMMGRFHAEKLADEGDKILLEAPTANAGHQPPSGTAAPN